MASNRHEKRLTAFAATLGFTCVVSGGGHLRFNRPNTQPVFTSQTPSCPRAFENAKRDLRHAVRDADGVMP